MPGAGYTSMNSGNRAAPLALLLGCMLLAAGSRADVGQELIDIHERLFQNGSTLRIFQDADIHERRLVSGIYQLNDYRVVWPDPGYAGEMVRLLQASEAEGLEPADYHVTQLQTLLRNNPGLADGADYLRAKFDMLLTDGLLLYARHLIQGKVDPRTLDSSWNYARVDYDPDAVAKALLAAVASQQVASTLERFKPRGDFYARVKAALAEYRSRAGTEDFRPVPGGVTLRPGDSHTHVRALRERLAELGYLDRGVTNSDYFDEVLAGAVRRLQGDFSIDIDGVAGPQTFEAINVPLSARVEQLRVNLDRLRWISQDISEDYLVVNIAGYELYYMRNGTMQWETAVMTGAIDTRTPIFQAPLRYLEFNPTWNVPRSILARDLFAKFRANPQRVVDQGYVLYNSRGETVDPLALEWDRYTGENFPYRVVQMPGPDNAMGRVKFMFPNQHAVYLHDTPARALFYRSQRAFSAGCIRVQNPLELARVLLDDPVKWSAAQIQSLVDSGRPRQVVHMQRDVDVLLMYWTVSPAPGDGIQFHRDVYGLDPAALAALNAPPGGDTHAGS